MRSTHFLLKYLSQSKEEKLSPQKKKEKKAAESASLNTFLSPKAKPRHSQRYCSASAESIISFLFSWMLKNSLPKLN
jgi:hypothetical protein